MAIRLNGTNQFVNLGTNVPILNGSSAGTIMAWVRPRITQTSRSIMSIAIGPPPGTSATTRMSLEIGAAADQNLISVIRSADGDAGSTVTATGGCPVGIWTHAAVSFNCVSKRVAIYVNGVLSISANATSATGTAFSSTNSKNAAIGSGDDGTSAFVDGDIEDVRVYGRLVSDDELLTIVATKGSDGILDSFLQFRFPLNEAGEGVVATACPSVAEFSRRVATPTNSPTYIGGIIRGRNRPKISTGAIGR